MQTATDQKIAQALLERDGSIGLLAWQTVGEQSRRQAVVAINARQFFDEIGAADLHIEAMRRHRRPQGVALVAHVEFEGVQNADGLGLGKRHTQKPVDLA